MKRSTIYNHYNQARDKPVNADFLLKKFQIVIFYHVNTSSAILFIHTFASSTEF